MRKIRLSERNLYRIIRESIRRALNEDISGTYTVCPCGEEMDVVIEERMPYMRVDGYRIPNAKNAIETIKTIMDEDGVNLKTAIECYIYEQLR